MTPRPARIPDMLPFRRPPLTGPLHRAVHEEDGFSLPELLIVLVIIGILAALAIPRFFNVTTRAKMTEARLALSTVHTLQEAYLAEHDVYSDELAALGYDPPATVAEGGSARYRVAVDRASGRAFVASATATVDFDDDGVFNVWEIDEAGTPRQRTPD